MTIEWNKVTWYSKLIAVAVFLATFVIAFDLGILWEQVRIETALTETSGAAAQAGGAGAPCGGFIRNAPACAAGYRCKLGAIADKGGVCVPD